MIAAAEGRTDYNDDRERQATLDYLHAAQAVYVQKATTTVSEPQQSSAPPRQLGFWMAVALVIGNMIGSGVFLLPALARAVRRTAIVGWIFTATAACCSRSCSRGCRASTRGRWTVPHPRVAFGDLRLSRRVGLLDSVWVGNAAIAIGLRRLLAQLGARVCAHQVAPAPHGITMLDPTFVNSAA